MLVCHLQLWKGRLEGENAADVVDMVVCHEDKVQPPASAFELGQDGGRGARVDDRGRAAARLAQQPKVVAVERRHPHHLELRGGLGRDRRRLPRRRHSQTRGRAAVARSKARYGAGGAQSTRACRRRSAERGWRSRAACGTSMQTLAGD
jgi:hypothetical protein